MSNEPQASTTTTESPSTLLGGNATSGQSNTTPEGQGAQATSTEPPKDGQTTPDTKTTETKVGEVKKGGVPEKYEFKFPEGMKVGDEVINKFTSVAKDLGMSQENAQKLMDLAMENAAAQLKSNVDAWDAKRMEWVNELKSDKEFGGDKLPETITRAKRALSSFSTPSFIDFLEVSGFGDNAELIKFLARVDKKIGEDTIHNGNGSANSSSLSDAELIYGKPKQ